MAVALETVVKQLEDSGIVAPGKLENFIPPKAHPKTVEELVRELVKQNHLTKFQAQQVALGKAKALILGGYTILDKIGAGGMGQVFKALHRRMERIVAIKMLPAAMLKDAAAAARFQREVVAAAKLEHPNIVTAHDADEANGIHFLVMQYVEGTDLSALVKKHGPLEGSKALNYVLQAAKGLEFAHKKGVVHRDIKPANLLLDKEGTVKILDMGLARIEAAGDQATQAELTGTGAVMGTVDYMSPEQAFNTKHADARADIYSLGCTLYYLLAGKATYDGETVIEKILGHREKPIPSLSDVQDGVPEAVQAIFERMVAKKAEDRYQTMTKVIVDLEKAIVGQSSPSNLNPPAETSDTGLTKFFKELPSPSTQRGKPVATKQVAAPVAPVPKKANPKLVLYGSIAGGVLSLIGIPLVLYLALSGGDKPNGKVKMTVATAGPISNAVLPPNFALEFDGKTSYVEVPTLERNKAEPLTIEAWIRTKFDAARVMVRIEGKAPVQAHLNHNVLAGLETDSSKAKGREVQAVSKQAAGVMIHVAYVIDDRAAKLFVNGVCGDTNRGPFATPFSQPKFRGTWLGAQPRNEREMDFLFLGVMDELRISKIARYDQDFTPDARFTSDNDTLTLYHFDEGQGDQLLDSSPNKHHGKIVGAKWVKADGSQLVAPSTTAGVTPQPTVPVSTPPASTDPWVVYKGLDGPGTGKHIVLISGDEEYRSEEMLPQLGKILAQRHGFQCTVLFAIDPQDGTVKPDVLNNIPGLEALRTADLMILMTRFRDLPDGQMKEIVDYVNSGRPIIGLRTATHAFNIQRSNTYQQYSHNSVNWPGGFGRQVLGETWVAHHGAHNQESTRGTIAPGQAQHPILRGLKDGDVWSPTDVYACQLPLPSDCQLLLLGAVLSGMSPTAEPLAGAKNNPMMPVAWTRIISGVSGKRARIFTSTMGCAEDLLNEGQRRLLVNAAYWATSLEDKIAPDANVSLVGSYVPTPRFGFGTWVKGVKPSSLTLAMPAGKSSDKATTPQPAANVDPDRKAAEWVLKVGGSVKARINGQDRLITATSEFPAEPFQIIVVDLSNKTFKDDELAQLANLKNVEWVNLLKTPVSDAGLPHLVNLPVLRDLWLLGTNVTDAGLKDVSKMRGLRFLGLNGTAVSDAGLPDIASMHNLTKMDLRNTRVTPTGVAALQKSLPNCMINWDDPAAKQGNGVVDDERSIAMGVLAEGGTVGIKNQFNTYVSVTEPAKLPAEKFFLTNVFLSNLPGASDNWVAKLNTLSELRNVEIAFTPLGDSAVQHLTARRTLLYVDLTGTKVTDASLVHLQSFPALLKVKVKDTQVTPAGITAFQKALPKCQVESGK